jgi:hypothetical protein
MNKKCECYVNIKNRFLIKIIKILNTILNIELINNFSIKNIRMFYIFCKTIRNEIKLLKTINKRKLNLKYI